MGTHAMNGQGETHVCNYLHDMIRVAFGKRSPHMGAIAISIYKTGSLSSFSSAVNVHVRHRLRRWSISVQNV
ncbi:hypothetical protein ACLOJK_024478 [Asimina triloba]